MADQQKVVLNSQKGKEKKFKIKKVKDSEIDVDIEIVGDASYTGDYVIEKLSVENVGLPEKMNDGTPIRWLNNFGIKKNDQYINQKYKVTIPGISNMRGSRLVIFDGNGDPYYYTGAIVNDTFELTDGDPAPGMAP